MATGEPGRVLVVDDDVGMREGIEALLGAAGIDCAAYDSAEALLDAGVAETSICVISDLKLPAMSGLELLARLRKRGPRPPVILITAHDAEAVRLEAYRLGACAYLAKPFSGAALLHAIEAVSIPPQA